jgi:hypothetical protein
MVGAIDVEIAVGFACYRPRSRPNGAGEVVLECSEEDAREVALWPVEVKLRPIVGRHHRRNFGLKLYSASNARVRDPA